MPANPRLTSIGEGGDWRGMALFLIGALCWAHFEAFGQIYLSELLLAALLPFLLFLRGHVLRDPLVRTCMVLVGLWLGAQAATDIIRETDFQDYVRGWANIAMFLVAVLSLYLLLHGSRRRFILFTLGLALGEFLNPWLAPTEFSEDYPWKFGISQGVALFAVLAGLWRPVSRFPALAATPLLAVAAYSLTVGFRSMFACALLGAVCAMAQHLLFRRPGGARATPLLRPVIGFLAASLFLGWGSLAIYQYAASYGYLDERSVAVFERQSEGELGLLPGGRSALFATVPAIADSPIVGHGSKAKNPDYANRIMDATYYGYQPTLPLSWHTGLIPTHSALLGAWVEAGVLGVFFWVWFSLLIVAALAILCRAREPLSLLIFYMGFSQLWNNAFSTFAGNSRLTTAFVLCLFMVVWQVLRRGARQRPAPADRLSRCTLEMGIQGSEGRP